MVSSSSAFKINFAEVAKDLGYASATVAANRMRNLRKRLQEKREAKESKGDTQAKPKAKETDEKPKAKRGKKRKVEDSKQKPDNEEGEGV
ncbi:hypothetical protein TWF481_001117 [Arthrobotrys musiformis]|uniref:Myb-like DNA-binding domain-containing protein n=1 Tax=Arthrobotrys musiformis TaxID=47236 RepID=A0AAV9WPQ9_9PEZI